VKGFHHVTEITNEQVSGGKYMQCNCHDYYTTRFCIQAAILQHQSALTSKGKYIASGRKPGKRTKADVIIACVREIKSRNKKALREVGVDVQLLNPGDDE
jgi:hypothetical protein